MNLRLTRAGKARLVPFIVLTAFCVPTQAQELKLEKKGSEISFVGGKPDGTKHKGGFKDFDVKTIADFEDPSKSSINISIKTASLWSDNDRLTNHLKSPDFFDVRKHPTITFESTEIEHKESDEENVGLATIKGDMFMLGKKVAVDIPIKAKVTDDAVEMTASFKIDRTKWGMTYGDGKIDKDVKLTVKFNLKR